VFTGADIRLTDLALTLIMHLLATDLMQAILQTIMNPL